jgi:ribosomal protein S12 methylthiotransferase
VAQPKVHFVSLGCPKNRVDSEIMLGHLAGASMGFTPNAEDADVIVVNTCGFIEDAKKESIDVILEMARHRTEGRAKKLIVTGCLVQRYAGELEREIPEIDALLGNGEYGAVAAIARGIDADRVHVAPPTFIHSATSPRVNSFLPHSAYVKVSEGCDQKCTFCIIPALRGLQRSRPIEDVVREAEALAARGVVEINLVAQDLTGYGTDLDGNVRLADLLVALARVDGLSWIRCHYAYPRPFAKALIAAFAAGGKVLPYIDMPLQHIADPILRRMKRGRPRRFVEALLAELRSSIPDLTLRTSFIVGFPGETDRDFAELSDFVEAEDFTHVGLFRYSREEGTPSHDMEDQVPRDVIDERMSALTEILEAKAEAKMESFVGRTILTLVDGVSEETDLLLAARHRGQAPEVDGTTYINDGKDGLGAGDLVEVEITEAFAHDLVGRAVRVIRPAPPRPSHPRLDAAFFAQASRSPVAQRKGLTVLP